MMKNRYMTTLLLLLALGGRAEGYPTGAMAQTVSVQVADRDFEKALEAFERGMYERAMILFDDVVLRTGSVKAEGYSVLCSVKTGSRGWENRMESFISAHPSSELVPQLRFALACKLFDEGEYQKTADILGGLGMKQLRRSQYAQYLFNYGFSLFSLGEYGKAGENFRQIIRARKSDYTAPACYILGYMEYENGSYADAEQHFLSAAADGRFEEMASYYVLECRFLAKDYSYVLENGPELYLTVPQDRQLRLGRIISESYLISGNPEMALKYYNPQMDASGRKSRADLFFAGSMLYAEKDYKGAIENFSAMSNRSDSLGQIANYHLGWAYLQTGNKLASLEAFRDAASVSWDETITRDALFNSAKLSFDINSDSRPFNSYIRKYPQTRTQEIFAYMALAELYAKDWQAAVDAYDNVEELTPEMERNYVKANYLRAKQLISAGAFRDAVPLLKSVTFYSDRNSGINQLSRYWLSELHYRNGQYRDAIALSKDLYHTSALSGTAEGELIPYNIAYSYFRLGELDQASGWFAEYLSSAQSKGVARKDAETRMADCLFIKEDCLGAAVKYAEVARVYFDPDDVYPYLQAGIAYGLAGRKEDKIKCLEEVKLARPAVGDYSTAMIELGRCYMEAGRQQDALECFDCVISQVKDSSEVAQALLEKALVERNSGNAESALRLYMRVAENMPGSEYADNALLAIENVCRAEGMTAEYLAFMEKLGKGDAQTVDEREEFFYSSAQQLYFDARYDKALTAFETYISKYPQGRYVTDARYCMAECLRMDEQYERACDLYETVIDAGQSDYRLPSMQKFADLSLALEKYKTASLAYSAILNESISDERMRHSCLIGLMRASYKARQFDVCAEAASSVESDAASSAELKREALYIKAKSLLPLSRREEAMDIFRVLAGNPMDGIGAESRLILIKDKFDRADYAAVEDMVYAFSESGTGQNRFLADAFLVLGDSFAERGQIEQARATFESIRDGYKPESEDDDILAQVQIRLDRISQMN